MAQDTNLSIKKPMIILVNGASASASEILSGAMKDYHKAKIIGTKTYGKGMVQKIIPMPNETGLNLTIAKYLTPKGKDINKKGIAPDIEVKFEKKILKSAKMFSLKKQKIFLQRFWQIINQNKNPNLDNGLCIAYIKYTNGDMAKW